MSNLTALIASAELTEAKLNRFENILDTLLKDRSSSTRAIKINHQVETVDPTSISLTLTEISVGLLAWTSMCIGVASATKFEPLFTTLGTLACFVIRSTCLSALRPSSWQSCRQVESFLSSSNHEARCSVNQNVVVTPCEADHVTSVSSLDLLSLNLPNEKTTESKRN